MIRQNQTKLEFYSIQGGLYLEQKLVITYHTYRSWKYRRRDIPADVYLNDLVLFERALTKEQREEPFYTVAKRYHRWLAELETRDYLRYLKRRRIESVDDFYSHLHVFLSRYRGYHQEAGVVKPVEEVDLKSILEKTTKALRKDIYDTMKDIGSTNQALVMREFCNRVEKKAGGLSFALRSHNITSTKELYMIVKYVVEHPEEFEDDEVDL